MLCLSWNFLHWKRITTRLQQDSSVMEGVAKALYMEDGGHTRFYPGRVKGSSCTREDMTTVFSFRTLTFPHQGKRATRCVLHINETEAIMSHSFSLNISIFAVETYFESVIVKQVDPGSDSIEIWPP